ncbi:hypothetical protein GCM10027091_00220 [Streptomyces daliensis]
MPHDSFYTQDQFDQMERIEALRAENHERDPERHYLAYADAGTKQMYADAESAHAYFQVTGRKLDENDIAFGELERQRAAGHRVRTSDFDRAQRRFEVARSSHAAGTVSYLNKALSYEQRMSGFLDSRGVPRPGSTAQMAMATLPGQSQGSSHQPTTGHGHHSSHRSHRPHRSQSPSR